MSLSLLTAAHDSLAATVDGLGPQDLGRPSRATGWTIAQVVSHLGSGAEICTVLLQRGIDGDTRGPVREELVAVWQRWDALPPAEQAAAWQEADRAHLALLARLTAEQLREVRVPYFIGPLTVQEYAGYRLSETAVHAWDVQAALDPAARLLTQAVQPLLDRVDLVASRFRDGSVLTTMPPGQLAVHLGDQPPDGSPQLPEMVLQLGEELHLWPCTAASPDGRLDTDADGLLRLVYGRHPEPLHVTGLITGEQLRALFPGF